MATKTTKPNEPKIAFWGYDRFPYVLSGEVISQESYNVVETKEYGQGYWFSAAKIFTNAKGNRLKETLAILKAERAALLKEITDDYDAQVNTLLKKYGI